MEQQPTGDFRRSGPPQSEETLTSTNGVSRYASRRMLLDLYCVAEIAAVFLVGLAIARLYVGGLLGVHAYLDRYIWPLIALPLVMALVQQRSGLYEVSTITEFADNLGKVASGVLGAFITFALLGIVLGISNDFSRVWFGGWLLSSLIVIWFIRAIAANLFLRWLKRGALRRRAVIVGNAPEVHTFLGGIDPDDNHLEIIGALGLQGSNRIGSLSDLIRLGRESAYDMVIVAPPNDPGELDRLLNALSMLSVEIKVIPHAGLSAIPLLGISELGQNQLIDIHHSRISDWGWMLKAILDYATAAIALVMLSWLLLAIAVAIRLESKGPVLFRQKRTGLNNEEFMIYKFRTMFTESGRTAFRQTRHGDSRVTRVGRFLRRTSLDELPQLLNVLRGEMSIVGPRPHPIELNHTYGPHIHLFNRRHSVKPGITGWAQIHDHRGPVESSLGMRQRLNYDLYYIENWSIWFDLRIIAATPLMSLVHRNAV